MHLLEKGIDVKYIKKLTGHFDISATRRYLHVAKEKLVVIKSPFDALWEEESIKWQAHWRNPPIQKVRN